MFPIGVLFAVLGLTVGAFSIFGFGFYRAVKTILKGQPQPYRWRPIPNRLFLTIKEIFSHQRFLLSPSSHSNHRTRAYLVAAAHWLIMVSFPLLFGSLVKAYQELVWPLPLHTLASGGWWCDYGLEILATLAFLAGLGMWIRRGIWQKNGRFYGSRHRQARFVEAVIIGVLLCVLVLRATQCALAIRTGLSPAWWAYPATYWIGYLLASLIPNLQILKWIISIVAAVKIFISLSWLVVVGLTPHMGVAWHRFLAFFSIFTTQNKPGTAALGGLAPLRVNNQPIDINRLEEPDYITEKTHLGLLEPNDLSRKNLLDLTTCTECGRCQDICPAWAANQTLNPKLLISSLRASVYGAQAGAQGIESANSQNLSFSLNYANSWEDAQTGLWDCTTCGACVQVCPVDVEHLDIVAGLRRGQVLMESNFPKDLGRTFKNLERKSNPWGKSARSRLDWTKHCPVPVPVLGRDVEGLHQVDCLLWVGCAGAFDERGQKTTVAIARLLHLAGIKFCVLGEQENCTGDPARRSGNELLFQELMRANIHMLNEAGASQKTTIITACAHCFNTFAREYPEMGGTYRILHHSQYLNQLVRAGKLRPQAHQISINSTSSAPTITYHDPCYIGRHNQEYDAPRQLLASTNSSIIEMKTSKQTARCCGAGGAHAFFESDSSQAISATRAAEVDATGAQVVATACPFCSTMLSNAHPRAQVRDIAQILLDAVNIPKEEE